ncbi:ribosome biogenesis GTPase A [Desulfitispora alkaliphila]
METINWYPGHMVKTKRLIKENIKVIDVVVEIIDARVPESSRNPVLKELIGDRPLLLVINKEDLADEEITMRWLNYYKNSGQAAVVVNAITGKGLKQMKAEIRSLAEQRMKGKSYKANALPRVMIVGIPNSGKSSLINKLSGKNVAKTGNKPGVTRGQQWINLKEFQLMDVPGILWPKFECQEIGFKLAITGAIGDHVFDVTEVTIGLMELLAAEYSQTLDEKYGINSYGKTGLELVEMVGRKRGCLQKGGVVNLLKASEIILKEFRAGKIGKITLDRPKN